MEPHAGEEAVASAVQSPSPAHVAPATNADPDIQRIMDVCTKLKAEDRPKMLKICESFLIDANRDRGGYYISSYVPDPQPFRFMDLPIELRVEIARYALASDEPLSFQWSYGAEKELIGSFRGLEELTALTRVSKQLHTELANITWTVNTHFRFDSIASDEVQEDYDYDDVDVDQNNIMVDKALVYFSKVIVNACFSKTLFIIVKYYLRHHREYKHFREHMSSLAKQLPMVKWTVINGLWNLTSECVKRTVLIADFMSRGRQAASELAKLDADGIPRNWNLLPLIIGGHRTQIKQKLLAAGFEEAAEWMDRGV
ncbi:hypothetical protein C7974DRAFT_407272 [Boeremia exigua]|uniref:uncharacterized protein n=1 Tax=Boeremia exigua TaxID=749465 RepID=UPI001E8E7370|nr:uncharacterized protein C7974DRAFT_407272 [Boeremia exigua]KAH6643534.1 hypothetical protein C7974DRAFT_407272 [Boeremia exigua]